MLILLFFYNTKRVKFGSILEMYSLGSFLFLFLFFTRFILFLNFFYNYYVT